MTRTIRMNLRLTDDEKKRIARIRKKIFAASDTEVIRRALVAFEKQLERESAQ